ncbi:DNA excision repair protein Rad2 [Penicillium malachiteum]|uniref:DNA excision repair protein Rad2 n=1 Tax=Penicillium malachiteum TaxID=1324776 RepID=UPI00254957E2|nr:DNA excision repair protein Rad2 [Penicillium malachiteum]KAJ5729548.1 DNA excision repair protein Rad2 [Penicillium malachiteum]
MGVTGLWTVVQPCARPIKLETLNKKRLAVDASIWIYQFLKAVRDKEGNALRNSHVVGFFRRICKLLYVGILPVFVFDGGAPVLKRETINRRKRRREGRREDATRTAGKLLAVQMQRIAEEEAETRRQNKKRAREDEEEVTGAPVYVEEALMTDREKQQNRKFKKTDAYHLPTLESSLEEMGAPNDPRIMSQLELEEYARQFHQGHDINLYDFSNIDFDSPFFLSLPATDRYNILNAARLRSRLRMGYSKEQLDVMFPNRMDFSRFQIERVKERNDLTQRLMNINGMNGEEAFYMSGQRVAGERGREYILVKDSQNAGGWVLGVVGNKREGEEDKPIDVDKIGITEVLSEHDSDEDSDQFEDVPIEGLNRLPKLPFLQAGVFDSSLSQPAVSYGMNVTSQKSPEGDIEDDALFVPANEDLQLRNTNIQEDLETEDDDDLRRAIALSMQIDESEDYDIPDIPINRPMDPQISSEIMPDFPDFPDFPLDESDDDAMDFTAAVAQTKVVQKPQPASHSFDGPLPFASIKLTKAPNPNEKAGDEGNAGGFVKDAPSKSKKAEPLPPWFFEGKIKQRFMEEPNFEEFSRDKEEETEPDHLFLSNRRPPEIIDVDDIPDEKQPIDLDEHGKKAADIPEVLTVDELQPVSHIIDISTSVDARPQQFESPTLDQNTEIDTGDHSSIVSSPEPEFEDVLPETIVQVPEIIEPTSTMMTTQYTESQEQSLAHEPNLEDTFDMSDPEEEELMQQLAEETEEHARFAQALNSAVAAQTTQDYDQELRQLRSQQQKDRRDADEVTQIMINECQQLLKLFGLPYITAPMEAEAQCAELVSLGLVDGIVTDDSDTFLFGGTRVYKNMFNQSKYVECYLMSDFEKEYSLHRQKLISFAHLLGSDYTEGISGIGPVTALEIVTEFSSLAEFRDWWTQIQMGVNNPDDTHLAFRKKFRKKASKIFLPPGFPDERVENAYLEPEVDSDPSQFQWGVPDLHGLRHFLMVTIGWSQERTDEVLVPVIRDMNRRQDEGTQSNITQFMQGPQGAGAFAPRVRSTGKSRMEKAFGRLQHQAQISRGSHNADNQASNAANSAQ